MKKLIICLLFSSQVMAQNNLTNFPAKADPKIVGKRTAERFMSVPHSKDGFVNTNIPATQITYQDVCVWLGTLDFAKITKDTNLTSRVIDKTLLLLNEEAYLQPKFNHVDNFVFGAVPLAVYKESKNEALKNLGLKYADEEFKTLTPQEYSDLKPEVRNWYAAGYSWVTRFWMDDMYMITTVQSKAYDVTKNEKYLNRAAHEMVAYLDTLQNKDGLFYHAPDVPFYWGRGDGWLAAGMTNLLKVLPKDHPNRPRIMKGYLDMMKVLLKYQDKNGMWHQLINDPNAWAETSCTGMFTYAFIVGVKKGWLPDNTYGKAARKAWIQLQTYVNEKGDITEVCEGTNKKNDHQYYLDRKRNAGDLHGQAPLLWCANALLGE
jgi:rhamnogalacturonyl hydrolase YesR